MFKHGFVLFWVVNVALMLSSFLLVGLYYHKERRRVLKYFLGFVLIMLMANVNIFILFYLNINLGTQFFHHWFFLLFFGGFTQAFYVFLIPRIAFHFFHDEMPRERRVFFNVLAILALIKVIPALINKEYELFSKIIGDIFILLVLIEVTILHIKSIRKLKTSLEKKIGWQGFLFLWFFFSFSLGKYATNPDEIGNKLIIGWGIQLLFFWFALTVLVKTIQAYLKSHQNNDSFSGSELTGREQEIVQLVLKGLSNKDIAGKIYVSENTVKKHLQNIYQKLGLNSKLQLLSRFKSEEKSS